VGRSRLARRLLLVTGATWIVLAFIGLGVAVVGRDRLLGALPPLAIDAEALGGALTAIALAAAVVGAAHIGLSIGLSRGWSWARTAGILLAGLLSVAFGASGAAAVASGLRETALALPLMGTALLAAVVAIGYAIIAGGLVAEVRSSRAT
jgi:hypothetical protein